MKWDSWPALSLFCDQNALNRFVDRFKILMDQAAFVLQHGN